MPSKPDSPPASGRSFLANLFPEDGPIDVRIVGRTLLHAALVGAAAGVVGALFFGGLELVQRLVLEHLVGYVPLRAHGEHVIGESKPYPFRPYLLVLLPALGGLLSGLLTTRFAPEAQGGGGDAMLDAYHHRGAHIRRRVIWVKALASIFTLGSGGSGGREGPTMQIGAAIGSSVARALNLSARERRILLIAGVAAGISAVFRTPLGAALLAVEILYRDDFESDALIPAILASVISYSVVISIYGETTLFAHAARYPFVPAHLPLYTVLALLVSLLAAAFVRTLRTTQKLAARLPGPVWLRPAAGGLILGILCTPLVAWFSQRLGQPGQGLGLFGGGYGAVQLAITGASWLPNTWTGVALLLLLCGAKLCTSSLTIGSGGSAGDFAPSLVLGGLLGGAFGRALALLLHDPRIDPGAFALVGMGTFYGGIAHAPLSALVLVCEMAGSYDLLVPLMLAEGVAFVALRGRSLYSAQVPTKHDSPVHSADHRDVLSKVVVDQILVKNHPFVSFRPDTPTRVILNEITSAEAQEVFPVLDAKQALTGIITKDSLLVAATEREGEAWTIALDLMRPAVSVRPSQDLRLISRLMIEHGLREIPVTDEDAHVLGLIGEEDVARAYLEATEHP